MFDRSRDTLKLKHTVIRVQQFQVVATETLNPSALESDIHCATATEKIDGTCCYVTKYRGIKSIVIRNQREDSLF